MNTTLNLQRHCAATVIEDLHTLMVYPQFSVFRGLPTHPTSLLLILFRTTKEERKFQRCLMLWINSPNVRNKARLTKWMKLTTDWFPLLTLCIDNWNSANNNNNHTFGGLIVFHYLIDLPPPSIKCAIKFTSGGKYHNHLIQTKQIQTYSN